jgi:hypothetical protein
MAILFDLIDRPRQAFTHVVAKPKSLWTAVILILISLIALSVVNITSSTTASNARLAQFANITPGAFPQGPQGGAAGANGSGTSGPRQRGGQGATAGQTPQPGQTGQTAFPAGAAFAPSTNTILTPIVGVIFLFLSWLLIAFLGHFLGILFRGTGKFVSTFAVGVWTTIPFFFRDLTQLIFQLSTTRTIVYQGLSFWAPIGRNATTATRILSTALASIDPFAIWFLVLLGVGIAAATKIRWWKSILIAVFIFLVLIGIRLLPLVLGLSLRVPVLG